MTSAAHEEAWSDTDAATAGTNGHRGDAAHGRAASAAADGVATGSGMPAGPGGQSWTPLAPVQLELLVAALQAGETVGPLPKFMARTDGVCLVYPGEITQLAGEPESGKGWIAVNECAHRIAAGDHVLYLDFEDAATSVIGRLLALGAVPEAIVERFTYVRPDEPLHPVRFYELVTAKTYALAVIDGVTEAYTLLGLEINDNSDASRFQHTLARPLAATGAAVIVVDHVTKSREGRGRHAIGAAHKLAGIASAYMTDVVKTPSRTGEPGLVKLTVGKDRHGHVRGDAVGDVIAMVRITAEDDGARVTVTLEPPESSTNASGEFRPTTLMERVSEYLDAEPGATGNDIRRGVTGQGASVDRAVRVLRAEGYVDRSKDGAAYRHTNLKRYRFSEDLVHASQARPDRVPDTSHSPSSTASSVSPV